MTTLSPDYALDVVGAGKFDKVLMHAQPTDGVVTIDLSAVRFVASSGLRVILKAAQRLGREKAEIQIINANPTIREVFRISGFDTVVTIREEDAHEQ